MHLYREPSRRPVIWILALGLGLLLQSTRLQEVIAAPMPQQEIGQAERVSWGRMDYDCFLLDLKDAQLQMRINDDKGRRLGSLARAKNFWSSQDRQLVFATNGGMFNPRHEPNGLFISEGTTYWPLNLGNGKGNFYLKPNGVFLLTDQIAAIMPSEDFPNFTGNVRFATQSGPMLVHEGKIHSGFNPESSSRYVRSGVGLISPDRVVFAISRQPVNFYRFATLFKEHFGCSEALFLDGGISKMYLPAANRHDLDGDFAVLITLAY